MNFINCITWFNPFGVAYGSKIKFLFYFSLFFYLYLSCLPVFVYFYPTYSSTIYNFVIFRQYQNDDLMDLKNCEFGEIQ